mgnify:CR=1 FL=1
MKAISKRYQVFVSSTYEDLQDERKTVMQTLLEMDCIPCGMELFPASNDDQWTFIKKVIDDCDYYVLILGGRYGSTNQDGMGFTEMEYRYAVESSKPIATFVIKEPQQLIGKKIESTDEGKAKLKAFRKLVQKKLTKYWTNKDDLAGAISLSMNKLIRQFPSPGWVKADEVIDEKSIKEIMRLQKENEELKKQVTEYASKPPIGSEKLAQGDDKIHISMDVSGYWSTEKKKQSYFFEVSWNSLFSVISPYLINENTEIFMVGCIEEYLHDQKKTQIDTFISKNSLRMIEYSLKSTDFQKIKVQFRALGLIEQSIKSRSVKDQNNYWKLTPYGDYIMTQLIAVKKD